jgi:hypothetical protein
LDNVKIKEVISGENVKGEGNQKYASEGKVVLKLSLPEKLKICNNSLITLYDNKNTVIGKGKTISESEEDDE